MRKEFCAKFIIAVVFIGFIFSPSRSNAQGVECKDTPVPAGYVITRVFTEPACNVTGPNNAYEYQIPKSGLVACSNKFSELRVLACEPTPASRDCPNGGYKLLDPMSCARSKNDKVPGLRLISPCSDATGIMTGLFEIPGVWFFVAEKRDPTCYEGLISPDDRPKIDWYRYVLRTISSVPAPKTISKCTSGSDYPGPFWMVTKRFTSDNCRPSSDRLKPNTESLEMFPDNASAGHVEVCIDSHLPVVNHSFRYRFDLTSPSRYERHHKRFHTDKCGSGTTEPNTEVVHWEPFLSL